LSIGIRAQEKGIEPEWDIRPVLKEIAAHAERMVPVLEQIDAKEMAKNGAPDTYITQLNESKVQAKALATEVSLHVAGKLFELTGARSTQEQYGFDRHWRNARTHTLHDPVRYKYVNVGNYYLNGTPPPRHGAI